MSQSAESIVVNLLKNHTAISDIVGNRIYSGTPFNPQMPLIFMMRTDTENMGKKLASMYAFERAELTIYCETKEMDHCIAMAQEVKRLLNGYSDANCQLIDFKREVANMPADAFDPLMSSRSLIYWVFANGY